MKGVRTWIAVIMAAVLFMGCSTKVTRIQTDSTVDLSGKWNDADSRFVADEMIEDALSQRWLYKYQEAGERPTVIVGNIVNKTHEHISVETFVKDIERALLNSGQVDFVASKTEREQLREEKSDMQQNASVQTAKSLGEETGADLMLIGSINTIVDQQGGDAVVFYQTNMELIEIESNRKVWIGEKKIKKLVERSSTRF